MELPSDLQQLIFRNFTLQSGLIDWSATGALASILITLVFALMGVFIQVFNLGQTMKQTQIERRIKKARFNVGVVWAKTDSPVSLSGELSIENAGSVPVHIQKVALTLFEKNRKLTQWVVTDDFHLASSQLKNVCLNCNLPYSDSIPPLSRLVLTLRYEDVMKGRYETVEFNLPMPTGANNMLVLV